MMTLKLAQVLIILFLGICVSSQDGTTDIGNIKPSSTEIHRKKTVEEGWLTFEERFQQIAKGALKMIIPKIMEIQSEVNLSSTCIRDCMMLMNGVMKVKPWALRFLDSSGKTIDGLLTGTLSSFGAYDECLNTVVNDKRNKSKILFRGSYCTLDVKPPLPPKKDFYKSNEVLDELKNFSQRGTALSELAKNAQIFYYLSIRLGICLPSGCSLEDVDQLGKSLFNYFHMNAKASRCEIKKENEYPPLVLFVMCAYSFLGLLMLLGSLIDMYCHYSKRVFENVPAKVLLAFSLISNFRRFTNTKASSDTLSCIHGIRFFSISWIILRHTYFIVNYQIFTNLELFRGYAQDFAFQAITNATVVIDTFFCMEGLLVTYMAVKIVQEGRKKFSIKLYAIHRLLRFLPVYAYVIIFIFLTDLMSSGPIWLEMRDQYVDPCYKNWWTNLIFINNFYHADHICIPQSWYVACDMQLYMVALMVLILLLKWPRVGLSIAGVGILLSVISAGILTYLNNYPPTLLFIHPDPEQKMQYMANYYFKPYVHAGPYGIGLIIGYLLATRPKLRIPKPILVVGWFMAITTNMSVLYGVWEWNSGRDPTFWETMFYSSCSRVAWTFGVAWMIVCCATGHGGVINHILSWQVFIPLGRLTFIAYLIHSYVQFMSVGNMKTQLQPHHYIWVWMYFAYLCVTYAAAFAGFMLVEAPILNLQKIAFPRREVKKPQSPFHSHGDVCGNLNVCKSGNLAAVFPAVEGSDNWAFVTKL